MKNQIIAEKQQELLRLMKIAADRVRELADTGRFQVVMQDRRVRPR